MSSTVQWIWSPPHNDHYYVTYDQAGNVIYHWSKEQQNGAQQSTPSYPQAAAGAHQSAYSYPQSGSSVQQPLVSYQPYPPGSQSNHNQFQGNQQLHGSHTTSGHQRNDSGQTLTQQRQPILAERITGTPLRGMHEPLDHSYKMRTGSEARDFFVEGRVFAVLWAESASEIAVRRQLSDDGTVAQFRNPGYTTGRFGEIVYSSIRRFIVVQVKRKQHFVYAIPITTYSGRGVTKPDCNAAEHAIVYFTGTDPVWLEGEKARGMTKEPIQITPSDPNDTMSPASRVRFGKHFPVEWNVKVKDIGMVINNDMPKLLQYFEEE